MNGTTCSVLTDIDPQHLQDYRQLIKRIDRDLRDTLTKDAFIDALNDDDIEWFVRKGKSAASDGALQLALEYEVFQNERHRRHGPKAVIRGQVESNYGNELDDEIVGRIAKLNLISSVTPAAKHEKGACFICGSLTHFKSECLNRKSKSKLLLEKTGSIEKKPQTDTPKVSSTGPGNENYLGYWANSQLLVQYRGPRPLNLTVYISSVISAGLM